jgi:hypothetical protein
MRFNPARLQSLIGTAMLWKYVFGISNFDEEKKDKENKQTTKDPGKNSTMLGPALSQMTRNNSSIKTRFPLPFPDIQSLCSYLFNKPFEEIGQRADKPFQEIGRGKDKPFEGPRHKCKQLANCFDVHPEVFEQVLFRAVVDTEETIEDLIKRETEIDEENLL